MTLIFFLIEKKASTSKEHAFSYVYQKNFFTKCTREATIIENIIDLVFAAENDTIEETSISKILESNDHKIVRALLSMP